jgi:hypothetical protein
MVAQGIDPVAIQARIVEITNTANTLQRAVQPLAQSRTVMMSLSNELTDLTVILHQLSLVMLDGELGKSVSLTSMNLNIKYEGKLLRLQVCHLYWTEWCQFSLA